MGEHDSLLSFAASCILGFILWLLRLERKASDALQRAKSAAHDVQDIRKNGTPGIARVGREVQALEGQLKRMERDLEKHEEMETQFFESVRDQLSELMGRVGELTGEIRVLTKGRE